MKIFQSVAIIKKIMEVSCSLQRVENRIEVLPLNYYGHDKQALEECINDVKNTIESHVFKAVGNIKYRLVLKAEKQLVNGFRYIKELLMQIHNERLYSAYDILTANGIDVYSVITDCFTIKASDLEKAKRLLNSDLEAGG